VVICLERGTELHMAQWVPLPLSVSCSSKIQIGFTFLVPAHPGSPGQRAVVWVCMCVCACHTTKEVVLVQRLPFCCTILCRPLTARTEYRTRNCFNLKIKIIITTTMFMVLSS